MDKALSLWMRIVLLGLMAGACSKSDRQPGMPAVGCYEPSIGPYAFAKDEPAGREFQPAWVKLDSSRSERRLGYSLHVPRDFTFPFFTRGEWSLIGADSVLIQWGGQHAGVQLRLEVEPNALRGRAWFGGGGPSFDVLARRVRCGPGHDVMSADLHRGRSTRLRDGVLAGRAFPARGIANRARVDSALPAST